MTWALFAPMEDMEYIAAGFKETGLSGPLRNKLRNYWDGGLSDWQTAPCIPADHPCFATDGVSSTWVDGIVGGTPTGTCMRMIVVTFGTVADFRSLLRELIGKNPDAGYYVWLEPFIASTGWYAVDPWPAPAGWSTGMIC
jgi:hypothetical protein